ncbi:hypothetical protein KUCAC02_031930, partial [Chaenocephalus aceratus]
EDGGGVLGAGVSGAKLTAEHVVLRYDPALTRRRVPFDPFICTFPAKPNILHLFFPEETADGQVSKWTRTHKAPAVNEGQLQPGPWEPPRRTLSWIWVHFGPPPVFLLTLRGCERFPRGGRQHGGRADPRK